MKHFYTTATLIAALAGVGQANASTVYIDLGDSTTTTGVSETYNNVSTDGFFIFTAGPLGLELEGAAATTSPIALVDTTGAASGISFDVEVTNTSGYVGDNGGAFAGPFPAVLSGIETSALESHWAFARGIDANFTFSGLDDSKTYEVVFYGGHDQAGDGRSTIDFSLTTGSSTSPTNQSLDTFDNQTDVLTYSGLSSSGGTVQFLLDNNDVASAEGWLNFVSIEVVPEPGSLALLGVGGLFVLRRRRSS